MGQIRGFFRSDFSAFGEGHQLHWNLIWKSSGFVPFGANLTHFGLSVDHHLISSTELYLRLFCFHRCHESLARYKVTIYFYLTHIPRKSIVRFGRVRTVYVTQICLDNWCEEIETIAQKWQGFKISNFGIVLYVVVVDDMDDQLRLWTCKVFIVLSSWSSTQNAMQQCYKHLKLRLKCTRDG